MPLDQISKIYIGAADGKYEYAGETGVSSAQYETFVWPKTVNEAELVNGRVFLVRGFRGTGKTSLLRWLTAKLTEKGHVGKIVLFKTDLSEGRRVEISKAVGIKDIIEVDSRKMGISQDFKEAWRWFLHRTIAEIAQTQKVVTEDDNFQKYVKLVGLEEKTWFERAIAGLPKFDSARIRIKAMFDFVSSEVEVDTKGGSSSVPASTVVDKLDARLAQLKLSKPLFVCLDELEVFFNTPEQYARDLNMVRDLLFATSNMNQFCRQQNQSIRLYAGIRSEVLDAIGSSGQEVQRLVSDCGTTVAWHHEKRGMNHPLLQIIRRKIWASEAKHNVERSLDPMAFYFPEKIGEFSLDEYILDKSFYKPRDLVQRLRGVQKFDPTQAFFTTSAFISTEKEYSGELWGEVGYELSATYSPDEVSAIEGLFIAKEPYFDASSFYERLRRAAESSRVAQRLMHERGGFNGLLQNLYRIGAIGNASGSGSIVRQRWVFRGDPHLDLGSRMRLHPAFSSHLSVRHTKKRQDVKPAGRALSSGGTRPGASKTRNR